MKNGLIKQALWLFLVVQFRVVSHSKHETDVALRRCVRTFPRLPLLCMLAPLSCWVCLDSGICVSSLPPTYEKALMCRLPPDKCRITRTALICHANFNKVVWAWPFSILTTCRDTLIKSRKEYRGISKRATSAKIWDKFCKNKIRWLLKIAFFPFKYYI